MTVEHFASKHPGVIEAKKQQSLQLARKLAQVELGLWRRILREPALDHEESERAFAQIRALSNELGVPFADEERIHRRRLLRHSLMRAITALRKFPEQHYHESELRKIQWVRATLRRSGISHAAVGTTARKLRSLEARIRKPVAKRRKEWIEHKRKFWHKE